MEKLEWKFIKKEKRWDCINYIHPKIYIMKGDAYFHNSWILYFQGRGNWEIPFQKITTAKRVAQDIFNG